MNFNASTQKINVLINCIACFTFSVLAALPAWGLMPDSFDYKTRVDTSEIKPPKYLYNWLRFQNLMKWSNSIQQSGGLVLPSPLMADSSVVFYWPQLKGRNGVFAWINPVTGSMGGSSEIYGRSEALVRFEIDQSKAKAVRIVSDKTTKGDFGSLDLSQIDLVEHVADGLHEWLILRTENIVAYTADGDELSLVVAGKLDELRSQIPHVPLAELHTLRGIREAGNGPNAQRMEEFFLDALVTNSGSYAKSVELHEEELKGFHSPKRASRDAR